MHGHLVFDMNGGRQLECRVIIRVNRSIHQGQGGRMKDFTPREILEKSWLIPTEVAMELNNFIEIIMSNFIFEWYHSVSFDTIFTRAKSIP